MVYWFLNGTNFYDYEKWFTEQIIKPNEQLAVEIENALIKNVWRCHMQKTSYRPMV